MKGPRSSKGELVFCDNCRRFISTIATILHWENTCPFCRAPANLTAAHGSFYRRHIVETGRTAELKSWQVLYVEFVSARYAKRVLCTYQRSPQCFPFPVGGIRNNHASHCLEFVVLPGQKIAECADLIGNRLRSVSRATVNNRILWQQVAARKAA
jgi:hypothetical protein